VWKTKMHILKNPQKWYKWKLTRIYCSEAILLLFDIGVIEARGLTYKVIIEFLETNMYCSSENKTVIFRYAARMMRYFGKEGVCPDSFAMLLDRQIYPHVGSLEDFSLPNKNKVLQTYY
jgi:hypothetical protein